ncbi:MAG: hypothetical protein DRP45_02545, partial [Candidatus Zixiibacteriota bacterium]
LILDVREEEEKANTSLPTAIAETGIPVLHIPLGQVGQRLGEIEQGGRIIIICRRGARSYQASLMLRAASFDNVEIIGGGLQAMVY